MMPYPPPDPSNVSEDTVALEYTRAWDMPAGPRLGHASALRVPCSEGPASYTFELSPVPPHVLMREEPAWDPMHMSELGTEWTPEVRAAVHELDRPVTPPNVDGTV